MISMKTFFAVTTLSAGLMFFGCDQSKAELDSTKAQLTTVTAERDGL